MADSRRSFLVGGIGAAAGAALGGLFLRRGGKVGEPALLRPPGALPEIDFLASCIRCGQCVEACPYHTLNMAGAGRAMGTPFVNPRRVPCHLCRGYKSLLCIGACPSGALQPVPALDQIRMGTARILEKTCLAYNRVMCRSCWHACPFPDAAIRFDEMLRPLVDQEACIGCGLCTHACPVSPTAIVVDPRGQADGQR